MPTGPEARPLSHHAQAGLGAGTAGLGALLAMVVWVVLTLIGTGQAHFAAQAAKMRRHFAVARHGIRSQAANGRAIHIEGHAAGHHADIAFFQAGCKTGVAGNDAGMACLDTHGVLGERSRQGSLLVQRWFNGNSVVERRSTGRCRNASASKCKYAVCPRLRAFSPACPNLSKPVYLPQQLTHGRRTGTPNAAGAAGWRLQCTPVSAH